MATYRNTDKKPYDNILSASIVAALGGGLMKHTNKSISESISPCFAKVSSKRNRNVLDVINGTSAVISDPEPEGGFCPSARQLAPNNQVNSTKLRCARTDNIEPSRV